MQTRQEYKQKMNDVLDYLHAAEDAIGALKEIEDDVARVAFRESLTWIYAALAKTELAHKHLDAISE